MGDRVRRKNALTTPIRGSRYATGNRAQVSDFCVSREKCGWGRPVSSSEGVCSRGDDRHTAPLFDARARRFVVDPDPPPGPSSLGAGWMYRCISNPKLAGDDAVDAKFLDDLPPRESSTLTERMFGRRSSLETAPSPPGARTRFRATDGAYHLAREWCHPDGPTRFNLGARPKSPSPPSPEARAIDAWCSTPATRSSCTTSTPPPPRISVPTIDPSACSPSRARTSPATRTDPRVASTSSTSSSD